MLTYFKIRSSVGLVGNHNAVSSTYGVSVHTGQDALHRRISIFLVAIALIIELRNRG